MFCFFDTIETLFEKYPFVIIMFLIGLVYCYNFRATKVRQGLRLRTQGYVYVRDQLALFELGRFY